MDETSAGSVGTSVPKSSSQAPSSRKRRHSYTRVAWNTTESQSASTNTQSQGQVAQSTESSSGYSQPAAANNPTPPAAPPSKANGLLSSDYYLQLAERLLTAAKPTSAQKANNQGQYDGVPVTYLLEQLLLHRANRSPGNVLAYIDNDRWVSIIAFYDEEIGVQYPFLNLEELRRQVTEGDLSNAKDENPLQPKSPSDPKVKRSQIEDIAIHVLAIISIFADARAIGIANPWIEETYAATVARSQLQSTVNAADICLLILAAIFFFHSDREVLAWRGIGNVLRLLQENSSQHSGDLSLHAGSQIAAAGEKLYWCVYTLDRRWSFGTDLPFAVHDTEIDRHPMLDNNTPSTCYVMSMVSYCRISSDVRKWLLEPASGSASDMTRDFLDFRVVQWKRNLPIKLQYDSSKKYDPSREDRGEYRIRLLLYLRANQMRIIVHRTSANRLASNQLDPSTVNVLAEVSHDTIRTLVRLADETDIYHAQHKTYNHFLESALSSMLLVLGSINDDANRASCLQDAFDAVELIQRLSVTSPVSQRLLERLRNIHEAMDGFRARGSRAASQISSSLDGATSLAQTYSPDQSSGFPRLDIEQGQGNLARGSDHALAIPALSGRDVSDRDQQQRGLLGYSLDANQAMGSPSHSYPQTSSAGINTLSPEMSHSRRGFDMSGTILNLAHDLPFMNFPELGQFLDDNPVNFTF
ncbi:fungal specific transcription factor domain-containing [Trichoderma arundinaceum]|uniref:Fungal specific transcription factor domain-containing n=1 Tax=Trichoderma arundinaceum TaxID=490622 RepID=A0A395P069_TRIAR|nr:fungal specific transcription factor domain-containing [Trichoderma arundinaceum]